VKAGQLNAVPAEGGVSSGAAAKAPTAPAAAGEEEEIKFCKIDDPGCEACQ
jgi:ribonucleoside-diphosphate reductase alpha chain